MFVVVEEMFVLWYVKFDKEYEFFFEEICFGEFN